jgi:hypothetical protein
MNACHVGAGGAGPYVGPDMSGAINEPIEKGDQTVCRGKSPCDWRCQPRRIAGENVRKNGEKMGTGRKWGQRKWQRKWGQKKLGTK